MRPSLTLTRCQLIQYRQSPLGLPVLRLISYACMPSPLPRQDRENLFARTVLPTSTFPDQLAGRLLHQIVSRPAQRSLTLRPTDSRSRLVRPFPSEAFSGFVTSTAAPIATGWSGPVPGRDFHPLKISAFHGAQMAPF